MGQQREGVCVGGGLRSPGGVWQAEIGLQLLPLGAATPPTNVRLLWPILGGALGLVFVLGLVSGFLVWKRCRRREKFTSKCVWAANTHP